MIQQIVSLAVKFRVMVVGAAVVVLALAAAQLPTAPVQALPEFSPTTVQIQVEALGLSAAEVEQLITIPMEHLLGGVAWVDQLQSESVPGLSTIDLTFKTGTPLLKARQVVLERLGRADTLPNVGSPPVMIQPLSSESRVMMVGLNSKDLSLIDLSILAKWRIKPRLMGVPGVANVAIWGFRDRQLQVQVDPETLRKNGVTLSQVINSTGNALWVSPLTFIAASTPGTGGFIDTSTQRFTIQHILPITTAKDLSSVIIDNTGTRKIRLGQVATVVEDHQPLIGDALMSDGNPGLTLVIQKFPGASTTDVTRGIQDALNSMQAGLPNVVMDTTVYQSQAYVQKAMTNLGLFLAGGLALLLVGLLLLLSWRAALVVFVTVVLSLVAAAYAVYLTGMSLDLLVLAGLGVALAVVVSDGVIDACNAARRLREQRRAGGTLTLSTVLAQASSSTRGPLTYATLILLVAPLPLLFLDGVPGAFARPAVVAYLLAVLLSMVVTMTVTPALAYLLFQNESPSQRASVAARLGSRLFDRTVPQFLLKPRLAYAVLALLLIGFVAVVPQLSGNPGIPTPKDRTLMVSLEAGPGTSLTEMERVLTGAMADVRTLSGVRQVTATIGRAITGDRAVDVNSADLWVNLTDAADYTTSVGGIERALRAYPRLRSNVTTYSQSRLNAVQNESHAALAGTQSAIVVRVYGKDLTVLRTKAEQVRQRISQIDGVVGAKVQSQIEMPTLEVQVNLAAAQRYGLNPGDVRRAATTYYAGLLVGNIYDDQKVVDVIVQGTPKTQANTNIADLLVDTPAGTLVRLGELATVRVASFPNLIRHDAASRSLDVTADVAGRDVASVLNDIQLKVLTVQMPLEYHAEVLSDLATDQTRAIRLALLAIGALIAIFLLLQAAFNSWRMAILFLATLPMACAGGVVAAFLVGGVTNVGATMGILAALALAARQTLLLMRQYQDLESVEGSNRRMDIVIRVTRENAGPFVIGAVVSVAALVPVLVVGSTAGTELLFPLAVAFAGGLVSVTLCTMFVVPNLYLSFAPAASPDLVVRPVTVTPPAQVEVRAGHGSNGSPATVGE